MRAYFDVHDSVVLFIIRKLFVFFLIIAHALTPRLFDATLKFPYLTLLISGGNTLIGLVSDAHTFVRFGDKRNRAAIGNCIDKVARNLGLYQKHRNDGLSGGQLIEIHAKTGNPRRFPSLFDQAKMYCDKHKSCEFFFTGLDDSVYAAIKKELDRTNGVLNDSFVCDMCATVQHSLALMLKNRLERAIVYYERQMSATNGTLESVVVSGGVASNRYIFEILRQMCSKYNINLITPPIKYCTGMCAHYRSPDSRNGNIFFGEVKFCINTSRYQNLLSVRTWFLESDSGSCV